MFYAGGFIVHTKHGQPTHGEPPTDTWPTDTYTANRHAANRHTANRHMAHGQPGHELEEVCQLWCSTGARHPGLAWLFFEVLPLSSCEVQENDLRNPSGSIAGLFSPQLRESTTHTQAFNVPLQRYFPECGS